MRYLATEIGDHNVMVSADTISKIDIDVEGGQRVMVEVVDGKQVVKVNGKVVWEEPKAEAPRAK